MKLITYSLFGYNKARNENCFDFYSYLRGLMIQARMQRLIYPDWKIRLYVDESSYTPFKTLLDNIGIELKIMPNDTPLCKAMLWRIIPAFEKEIEAVICRDLDSPLTYKEANCVKYWMNRGDDKILHAITDSVSHNLPLMGGMIGIKPKYFSDKLGINDWEILINSYSGYQQKGSDQELLNRYVYPKFAKHGEDSIVQHYLLGMPNTFLSEYHNIAPEMECLPIAMKESNDTCGHIGASGWYETALFRFLHKHWDKFNDLLQTEKQFINIFYWANEN